MPVGDVRIGCSGWNYKHWREIFYPKGLPPRRWLDRYASCFDTVEINATFYRLPRREAVANWVAESPPGFLFAVKMSRYVTHVKRLREVPEGVALFYERIEPLVRSPKLGPVLWQLPPQFKRDDERLAAALEALPPGRHCFEFRHESWFADEVYELLRARGVALVIGDDPRRPFQTRELTADWTFVRFHGGLAERGDYSEEQLEEWARWLEGLEGDRYVYFNNDWEGFALRNALWLKERLGVSPVPVPDTLRATRDPT
jgi:uncharacterized protein YecE (DUF72 family)